MSNRSSKCLSLFLRTSAFVLTQHTDAVFLMNCLWHTKSIIQISCKSHLINTLIKESQAGVFIADEWALFYETAEHLRFGHEGVKPLMGTVSALQEAYGTKHVTKRHVNSRVVIIKLDMHFWKRCWTVIVTRCSIFRNQTPRCETGCSKNTRMCEDIELLIMAISLDLSSRPNFHRGLS